MIGWISPIALVAALEFQTCPLSPEGEVMNSRSGRCTSQIPGTHWLNPACWLLFALMAVSMLSAGTANSCEKKIAQKPLGREEKQKPTTKWEPAFSIHLEDKEALLSMLQMSRDGKILAAVSRVVHVFDVEKRSACSPLPRTKAPRMPCLQTVAASHYRSVVACRCSSGPI